MSGMYTTEYKDKSRKLLFDETEAVEACKHKTNVYDRVQTLKQVTIFWWGGSSGSL